MKYIILIFIISLLILSACTQTQTAQDRVISTPNLRDSQPLPEQQIEIEGNSSQETTVQPKIPLGKPQQLETTQLTITTKEQSLTYTVQIADENHEQRIGLMHKEEMPEDEGMIFLFNYESPQGFWMKNTLIPLDIIFIDKNWNIINIAQAIPCKEDPCPSYYSNGPAKYVLELNGGQAEQYNINQGDNIGLVN